MLIILNKTLFLLNLTLKLYQLEAARNTELELLELEDITCHCVSLWRLTFEYGVIFFKFRIKEEMYKLLLSCSVINMSVVLLNLTPIIHFPHLSLQLKHFKQWIRPTPAVQLKAKEVLKIQDKHGCSGWFTQPHTCFGGQRRCRRGWPCSWSRNQGQGGATISTSIIKEAGNGCNQSRVRVATCW